MRTLSRVKPSPATVLALIALFVALAGVGYAAVKVPKNSVGTKQVKDNSLTGTDINEATLSGVQQAPDAPAGPAGGDLTGTYPNPTIAGDAVNSAKIADNSVTGADVDESSLAKVPDADKLDGLDSTIFGRTGRFACGLVNSTATTDVPAASVCSPVYGPPSLPSGNGFVKVDTTTMIQAPGSGCPCNYAVGLVDATQGNYIHSFYSLVTLGNNEFGMAPLTGVQDLNSSNPHTYQVRVFRFGGTGSPATVSVDGNIVFVPFNVNGSPAGPVSKSASRAPQLP